MAFLGPTELKKILSKKRIITDGDGNNVYNEKRVEEAAYALSLGSEAYRTDNKDRKIEILDEKSKTIEINPGQFTLLMTDEYVCIPKDKLAFISIKAKQKLKGLINVSGFHVDPGFEGKLLFSVYNAGPSTITLETKKPYFLIWFSNLQSEASNGDEYNTNNHHQGQKSIPLDYVDVLKQGDIASPNELLRKIKSQEEFLNRILWITGIITTISIGIAIKIWNDSSNFD
ncbi:dCTP deaminase domain-containing protein, partial [Myroides sp. LoEW2-1]|uniref:dCTP deaminase domain-containing protein n=1 Tax=Myroides sp. LoEW2-1 TaxID=2683192 RepID=UPI001321248D